MEQGRFQIQHAGTALAIVLGTFAMIAAAFLLQSLDLGPSGAYFHDSPSSVPQHATWTATGDSATL